MFTEILNKVKKILLDPKGFFESDKKDTSIETAFKFNAILLIVSVVTGALFTSAIMKPLANITGVDSNLSISSLVVGYIMALVGTFIAAGIMHLWIKLFSGKGDYVKTFQMFVYANTPRMLFSWIPVLGTIGAPIYGLYIWIIGATVLHGFSKKKAFLVLALPAIIITVFAIVASVVAFAFLGAALQSSMMYR